MSRVPPMGGELDTEAPPTEDEISDMGIARRIEQLVIRKRLSPDFGSKQKRRKRLIRNLKRRRSYAKPVRGGTGKQSRTRRNRFK